MDVKSEWTQQSVGVCCRLCLNTERVMSTVQDVAWAYLVLTEQAGILHGQLCEQTLVCWECKAGLRRMLRLKQQALRARHLLEQAHAQLTHANYFITSLSQLTVSTKTQFDEEVTSDSVAPSTPDDKCSDSEQIRPKLEIELEDSAHNWDEWDDTGPEKCEVWTRDATYKSENEDAATVKEVKKGKKSRKKRGKSVLYERFVPSEADSKSYKSRVMKHLESYEYVCASCVVGFLTEAKFTRHNQKYHSEASGPHICTTCNCGFRTRKQLSKHNVTHGTMYRCKHGGCDFIHTLKERVQKHGEVHSQGRNETAEETHQCDVCQKVFKNEKNMRIHRAYHTSEQQLECDHCGKVMKTRTQMSNHMKLHTLDFMCDVCGKRCNKLSSLRMHMMAHLDPSHRPHECPECHKRFIDKFKLLIHSRSHSGSKPFQCENCAARFVSKAELKRHIKLRHLNENDMPKKSNEPRTKSFFRNDKHNMTSAKQTHHQCKNCGEKFDFKTKLYSHLVAVHNERPFKCGACDMTFKFQSEMCNHKAIHKSEKPYECPICESRFAFKGYFDRHVKKHDGKPIDRELLEQIKSLQCNVCGKKFKHKISLTAHITVHTGDRPYACSDCGKTFKGYSGLWSHKQLHKSEKAHQCSVCGAKFALKWNLTGHMKTHSNDKPFQCTVCGRNFPWKRNLRIHMKTHSKEPRMLDQ